MLHCVGHDRRRKMLPFVGDRVAHTAENCVSALLGARFSVSAASSAERGIDD